ncbi:Hachiman antiphage defense system protein HamA [Paenibacillus sp. KN14-4R]|uniref:Hachiman antiphage defense system protein HamA n=1 Tax=Paenibacillus sp. KN14-4R TaxID=3445773 RepID=UPI003F9F036E
MSTTIKFTSKKYKTFEVHNIVDNFSFFHIEIKNDESLFLKGLSDYIFNEDNLLCYAKNIKAINFEPERRNYVSLFRELHNFIDDENIDWVEIDLDLEDVLVDEYDKVKIKNGKKFIRLSKIGRIGEYIFHIFLSDYFNFNCIIPKVKLTTDRNMSVYGIDALFLDKTNQMILFGESKVANKLDNGITLVNKSLKNYEKEIREEYSLVLSNSHLKLNGLEDLFPGQTEVCITFDEFLTQTNTKNIGVPIFIAHGEEIDHKVILQRLHKKINRTRYFNLNTIYYVISLPIINKRKLFSYLTNTISEKLEEYNASANG